MSYIPVFSYTSTSTSTTVGTSTVRAFDPVTDIFLRSEISGISYLKSGVSRVDVPLLPFVIGASYSNATGKLSLNYGVNAAPNVVDVQLPVSVTGLGSNSGLLTWNYSNGASSAIALNSYDALSSNTLLVGQLGVGVNSTSASYPLDVSGNIRTSGTVFANNLQVAGTVTTLTTDTYSSRQVVINNTNGATGPAIQVTQAGPQSIAEFDDAEIGRVMLIANNGLTAFGSQYPTARVHISDTASNVTLQVDNFGGANALVVLNTGQVGINKTPLTALDVNGTVTGTLFAGSGASLSNIQSANLVGAISSSLLTSVNASNVLSGTVAAARLPPASTSAAGIVQLDGTVTSSSNATAASSFAVKAAADLANTKLPLSGGTLTGTLTINTTAGNVGISADGGGLSNVNASNLATGTVSAARLPPASTSAPGVVQLDGTVASTSNATAATSFAVKTAADLANTKLPLSGGTLSGTLTINTTAGKVGISADGGGLSNLNGANIATGTVSAFRLPSATTSAAGIAQLYDGVNSSSTTQVATANAVRTAYNAAITSTFNGGTVTGATTFSSSNDGPASAYVKITNTSAGPNALTVLYFTTNTGNGLTLFQNSSNRTADGGINNATIRNDLGDLRLMSKGGANGISVQATTGYVGVGVSNPSTQLQVAGTATFNVVNANAVAGDGSGLYNANASNISSGTLSSARLPASGVTASSYSNVGVVPAITVDATGRITAASNTPISVPFSVVTGTADPSQIPPLDASKVVSGNLTGPYSITSNGGSIVSSGANASSSLVGYTAKKNLFYTYRFYLPGGYQKNAVVADVTGVVAPPPGINDCVISLRQATQTTEAYIQYTEAVNCSANTTYTYSVWVKSSGVSDNIDIYLLNAGGGGINAQNTNINISNTWTQVSLTCTTAAGVTNITPRIDLNGASTNTLFMTGFKLETNASASPFVPYGSPADVNGAVISNAVLCGNLTVYKNDTSTVSVNSTPAPTLVATSQGNVGIGTSAPASKLDVNGDVNVSFNGTYRVIGTTVIDNTRNLLNITTANVVGAVTSSSQNTYRLRQAAYSAFLRNDTTACYLLQTALNDPDGSYNAYRPFYWAFGTGSVYIGNGALFVQDSGNVSIGGNTAPAYKLHVNGDVNATGLYRGNGSALTSLNASNLTSGAVSPALLPPATTSNVGAVQLYDGYNSTSTTLAATANAVKAVNDKIAGTQYTTTTGDGAVNVIISPAFSGNLDTFGIWEAVVGISDSSKDFGYFGRFTIQKDNPTYSVGESAIAKQDGGGYLQVGVTTVSPAYPKVANVFFGPIVTNVFYMTMSLTSGLFTGPVQVTTTIKPLYVPY